MLTVFAIWSYLCPFDRGAGYTFGAQVVKKFLNLNRFEHMLRAHQLCMDGYSELFGQPPLLSTVWSAPNVRFLPFRLLRLFYLCELRSSLPFVFGQYCYRCGNQASILEVGPNGERKWNVFSAAPENDTDGPNQAAAQMAKVCTPALTILEA